MRMGKAVRHPAAVLSMEVFLEEVEGDSSVDVILWARQGLGGKTEWCGHMKQLSFDSLDIPKSSPQAQVWRWESTCCPQRVDAPPCWRHLARPGQGSPSAASLKIVFGNRQPLSLHFSLALHPLKTGLIFVHNQRLFGLLPGADGGWEGERRGYLMSFFGEEKHAYASPASVPHAVPNSKVSLPTLKGNWCSEKANNFLKVIQLSDPTSIQVRAVYSEVQAPISVLCYLLQC